MIFKTPLLLIWATILHRRAVNTNQALRFHFALAPLRRLQLETLASHLCDADPATPPPSHSASFPRVFSRLIIRIAACRMISDVHDLPHFRNFLADHSFYAEL